MCLGPSGEKRPKANRYETLLRNYLTMKSANGVLILILGILSLVMFGCLTGIPAWVMGNNALREIDSGMADPNERGMVVAGRILGMISTILAILGAIFFALAFAGIIGLGMAGQAVR